MKFVSNNKVFDTETANMIIKFTRTIRRSPCFKITYDNALYRTQKGNWFTVETNEGGTIRARDELTGEEVQQILMELGAVDIYNTYFDTLEEG